MKSTLHTIHRVALAALALTAVVARADVITDWSLKADAIISESRLGTPPAIRVMALVQTAVLEAASAAKDPHQLAAAVATANRDAFTRLLPAQRATIEAAYASALAAIPDGALKSAGIAIGTQSANAVLGARLADGAATPEGYRPLTTPGVYVPTVTPAVTQWPTRKPWLMSHAAQFRPSAPPALSSEHWAREFNEVKALGGKASVLRTAEQTRVAQFWDYSLPAIYHGVVRSAASAPGRDPARNARLFAAVAQAMDDAMIAVFDAKYHYNAWRPVTAIRNGDADSNNATDRDASWASLIDAPMHPEFPSGHSILAAAIATVLAADAGDKPMPELETTSPTGGGAVRRWKTIDTFVEEISNARIWGGIHFRAATTAGEAMGRRIGELAVLRFLPLP